MIIRYTEAGPGMYRYSSNPFDIWLHDLPGDKGWVAVLRYGVAEFSHTADTRLDVEQWVEKNIRTLALGTFQLGYRYVTQAWIVASNPDPAKAVFGKLHFSKYSAELMREDLIEGEGFLPEQLKIYEVLVGVNDGND